MNLRRRLGRWTAFQRNRGGATQRLRRRGDPSATQTGRSCHSGFTETDAAQFAGARCGRRYCRQWSRSRTPSCSSAAEFDGDGMPFAPCGATEGAANVEQIFLANAAFKFPPNTGTRQGPGRRMRRLGLGGGLNLCRNRARWGLPGTWDVYFVKQSLRISIRRGWQARAGPFAPKSGLARSGASTRRRCTDRRRIFRRCSFADCEHA